MIMAAGLMSGTSLDGVDVAIVALSTADGKPQFELRSFETFPYDASTRELLRGLLPPNTGTAQTIAFAHRRLGEIYADVLQRALFKDAPWTLSRCTDRPCTTMGSVPLRCSWALRTICATAARLRSFLISAARIAHLAGTERRSFRMLTRCF